MNTLYINIWNRWYTYIWYLHTSNKRYTSLQCTCICNIYVYEQTDIYPPHTHTHTLTSRSTHLVYTFTQIHSLTHKQTHSTLKHRNTLAFLFHGYSSLHICTYRESGIGRRTIIGIFSYSPTLETETDKRGLLRISSKRFLAHCLDNSSSNSNQLKFLLRNFLFFTFQL